MLNRRTLLQLLASSPMAAQSAGTVVNLDQHMAGMDPASNAMMATPAVTAPGASGIYPVSTRSGSNYRWGAYTHETRLTPTAVAGGLKKLFTVTMPGDARGLEAQPLFASSVTVQDGAVHDLMICCTMANQVWAHDANTGQPLWMTCVGKPVNGSKAIDAWGINDHWGIMSTPVIDSGMVYCVAWISADGTPANGSHQIFEVRLADGKITRRVALPTSPGVQRKQRAALTFTSVGGRRTVFVPFGTVQETAKGAHGFVTAVDVDSFKVTTEWTATPTGSGSGIWMAGQGLPADDEGYLYAMTGNGTFDGVRNFGESFLKLKYDGTNITVIDSWTPWLDADRGTVWDDQDLGSGAPIVIPELGLVLGAGKDSILYVLDWRKMGRTALGSDVAANYAKLKAPPVWFGFYPGPGVSAAPAHVTDLNQMFMGRTHHQHGSPLYWNGKLYCWGENGNLRAWSIDATGAAKYLGRSEEVASPYSPVPPGGMPGSMMCLSSNGNHDGVIWACVPDGDANRTVTTGRVFAFDASDFSQVMADGDHKIKRLWMSDPHHVFNKFNLPVVNGGRVYVPTYEGTVDVYGI